MKIKIGLEKLFYIFLMIFPCTTTIYYTAKYLNKWQFLNYLPIILLCILIILCINYFIYSTFFKINFKKEILIVIILTMSALVYRVLIIDYIAAVPATDFKLAYETAKIWAEEGYSFVERYADFPYWGNWAVIMSCVFRVVGDTTIRTAQMFNAVICAATVPVIYGIVSSAFKQLSSKKIPYKKIAFITASIYAFWPGISLYAGVLTNEHLAGFFGALTILFLTQIYVKENTIGKKKKIFLYICAGVSLGIMNWYKTISLIILIAWLIALLFFVLIPILTEKIKNNLKINKIITMIIKPIVIFMLSYLITNFIGIFILSSVMGISYNDINTSATWKQIYVGLDLEKNGKYSDSARKLSNEIIATYERGERNDIYKKLVFERMAKEYKQYPQLFLLKIEEEWGAERSFISHGWRRPLELDEKEAEFFDNVYDYNRLPMYNAFGFYYILVFILCLFGTIFMLRNKNIFSIFMCALTIFGFALMGLLIEAQSRYKSVIYFAITILAGVGTYEIYNIIMYIINKFIKQIYNYNIIRHIKFKSK